MYLSASDGSSFQRFQGGLFCLWDCLGGSQNAVLGEQRVRVRQACVGQGVVRLSGNGLPKVVAGLFEVVGPLSLPKIAAPYVQHPKPLHSGGDEHRIQLRELASIFRRVLQAQGCVVPLSERDDCF